MAIFKKISTQTDWSATANNRMSFAADNTAKLFYFDHSFIGLSINSSYWQIIDEIGSPSSVSGSLNLTLDNSNILNELRTSSFWSGDFDINFSYSNFSTASLTTERFVYLGMSSVGIDATTNINITLGIGIDSSFNMVIRAEIVEDNTTILYTSDFAETLGSGKLRIEKDGDTIFFYKLSGAAWILLGSFSNSKILSEDDLYPYITSEFATSVFPNDFLSLTLDDIVFTPVETYYGDITFDFNITEQSSKLYYLISSISDTNNVISIRAKSSDNATDLETASWSAFNSEFNGRFTVGLSDTIARFHVKTLTNNYIDSPIINSIAVSNSEFITENSDVSIISPVEGEIFDNIVRITWRKPARQTNVLGKLYYKIEYKNEDLNIDNYLLINNRVDPQKGLFDWDISDIEDDDAYEIRVTSFFDTSNVISKSFPSIIYAQDAGDNLYNGLYTHTGFHNGENLYRNNGDRILYYDGTNYWRLNDSVDNASSDYFSDNFFADWQVQTGTHPAPNIFDADDVFSSSSSDVQSELSSSFDFSSTSSTLSISSSSTSSQSSSSPSSSESSSTQAESTSSSSKSSSSTSSLSSSTQAMSTSSSQSSSSTEVLTSSSSSSVEAILRGAGNNSFGQLALGDNTDRSVFTPIEIGSYVDVKIISVGTFHSFLQKADGTVWGVGYNAFGQLGLGDDVNRSVLTQLPAAYDNAKKIACGSGFTIIERSDGSVWSCGRNDRGQLGLGDTADRQVFFELPQKYKSPRKIVVGSDFLVIEKKNGFVDFVGQNNSGQLGTGDIDDRIAFYESTIRYPKTIACGSEFTYIHFENGDIKATGNNQRGQLGVGDLNDRREFNEIIFTGPVTDIVAGGKHIFVVDNDIMKCCGDNDFGQLGLGDTNNRSTFVDTAINSPRKVRAGFLHSMIEDSSGNVKSCGYNAFGQLGLGDVEQKELFNTVSVDQFPEEIICGSLGYHAFILTNYAESESSSQKSSESDSSSLSIDNDDLLIHGIGYLQFSNTNMSDAFGNFTGDVFYIPEHNITGAFLSYISTSKPGTWTLEKFNGSTYDAHAVIPVGTAVQIPELNKGDVCRLQFSGSPGTKVYCYKMGFRLNIDSSSLST